MVDLLVYTNQRMGDMYYNIFVLHNSKNLLSFTCFYHLSLSKLPPTSDNQYIRHMPEHIWLIRYTIQISINLFFIRYIKKTTKIDMFYQN
jgi:hypothetical protein